MGDHRHMNKPSRYVSQLSLAIPPRVGAMSTSKSWNANRHTAWHTMVLQCKLVSGWGLRRQRFALCALWLGKDFALCYVIDYDDLNKHKSNCSSRYIVPDNGVCGHDELGVSTGRILEQFALGLYKDIMPGCQLHAVDATQVWADVTYCKHTRH